MITSPQGRSLELYFIDGKPDGMLTAEVFNWTGHVLMAPRTRFAAALKRKEASYTGIYLLLGEKDGTPCAYIGESENIADRLKNHDQKKDWWTTAVIVTTGADSLHKAHVRYLEARLVEIARQVGRVPLENGNSPGGASLSEAAQANMEAFLDYLLMVLPALRIDMFIEYAKPNQTAEPPTPPQTSPRFELINKKRDLRANATLQGDDFVVEAGSQARLKWEGKGTEDSSYAHLHEELRSTGVLVPDGERCVFAKSYAFRSPSAAAAVVNGRPANGTTEWKVVGTGKTYKEWEAAQLDAAEGVPA
jgi:hypothetical protein